MHRLAQTDAPLPLTSLSRNPCNSIRFAAGHKNGHSVLGAADSQICHFERLCEGGPVVGGRAETPRVVLSTVPVLCWKTQIKGRT